MTQTMSRSSALIQQRADAVTTAHDHHRRIVQLTSFVNAAGLELGAELYWFHRGRVWHDLGYPSFEAYLAQPEVVGRRTAFRLIRIHEVYVIGLGCDTESLVAAGVSKLDRLARFVHRGNVDDWLAKAASLSRSDLLLELGAGPQPSDNGRVEPITNDAELKSAKATLAAEPDAPERDTLRAMVQTYEAAGARVPELARDVVMCPKCGERIEL